MRLSRFFACCCCSVLNFCSSPCSKLHAAWFAPNLMYCSANFKSSSFSFICFNSGKASKSGSSIWVWVAASFTTSIWLWVSSSGAGTKAGSSNENSRGAIEAASNGVCSTSLISSNDGACSTDFVSELEGFKSKLKSNALMLFSWSAFSSTGWDFPQFHAEVPSQKKTLNRPAHLFLEWMITQVVVLVGWYFP